MTFQALINTQTIWADFSSAFARACVFSGLESQSPAQDGKLSRTSSDNRFSYLHERNMT